MIVRSPRAPVLRLAAPAAAARTGSTSQGLLKGWILLGNASARDFPFGFGPEPQPTLRAPPAALGAGGLTQRVGAGAGSAEQAS